ncbi:acetyltransferase (plasmid) [Paracoccus sp. TK19116]|uniref:Acetyltransferase n=1 Tax=Paracoccus albicereus TaxID=2922394 RepID=A0ABT1MN04_9RHOB|nr:GNAT family N-acetyltransferase [Paracoccus albicereus]MCQ0969489.1 acetyltransferase [Paracoccus albicereus]
MAGRYDARPANVSDLPMLRVWIAAPHIARWWGEDDPFSADELGDPQFRPWIVSLDGQPFAYLQDYEVGAWPGHHFGHLPAGARGIDQFIGVPEMIGKGHGTLFIAQHRDALFAAGAPVIATDPHPDNAHAIAVYRKHGFVETGAPRQSDWGIILPMEARRQGP